MPTLTLSFASAFNERVEPLMDGSVKPEGVEIIPTYSEPPVTFWRQLRFQDFDVSEMSLSSFLIAKSRGDFDYVGIPVFPSRRLFQTELSYNEDSGIKGPEDLGGKRLAVAEYQQTAALWTRGILEHDFGVSQYAIHWYMERTEELSHGGATGFKPPEGIDFQRIPPEKSMASMLIAGELDAAAIARSFNRSANVIERSNRIRGQGDWSKIKPLFPDRMAEGARFYAKHGWLPANHTYIVRGELLRKYPWLAMNLYLAFIEAKEEAGRRLPERLPSALFFGNEYLANTRKLIGDDPFAYGLKANADMLETLFSFSHEQGLTQGKLQPADLFAETTLSL